MLDHVFRKKLVYSIFRHLSKQKEIGIKFNPVCAKQISPSYSNGSEQDEAEIRHDRLSTKE